VLAFFALLFLVLPAAAEEAIRSFAADVVLAVDGSVTVTETIDVNAEGSSIRRGIFRDIPVVLINPDGGKLRSDLEVISITRDGALEPWSTEGIENGVRIRIGDADVFVSRGAHRYVIKYTMTRMARMFDDHDELYWNATGTYWEFPIDKAVATITLPDGAVIGELTGYTGPFGSTEQAVTATRTADNKATFRADRPLDAYEGLSVVATFQKGVLAEPDGVTSFLYWLSDRRDLILPLIAVGLVLLYNFLAWRSVGRDPEKGTIIPLFYAPKGYSPALTHYVHKMGWDNSGWTAFTASIFSLGVKGLVVIDNVGKSLKVTVTGKEPAEHLPLGETTLFGYFREKGTTVVNKTNGPAINKKREEFTASIENESREVYFKNNTMYVLLSAGLSIACLGVLVLAGTLDLLWLIISVVAGVGIGLLTSAFKWFWSGGWFRLFFAGAFILITSGNVLSGIASALTNFSLNTAAIAAMSIVAINVVFAILMRAPTVQGRKIMDQIDGFRMYLETAEKERLNFVAEPQMTVERFEGILPFAIALGVEKPWSQRFEGELARNAVTVEGGTYSPGWYHSSGRNGSFDSGRIANTVSSAAAGMSAAMIAAQPVQSSSSGSSSSGGGGFSGGGGGGGGGGGW
jgi:hypothetical protein